MYNTDDHSPGTKIIKKIWGPLTAIFLSIYFGYHIFQGERGVISWFQLSKKVKINEEQLSALTTEKETLEQRVKLLRPDSIDLDMLDEQARRLLNYSKKLNHGEAVILGIKSALNFSLKKNLIKKIASTGKPMIISTGMANKGEIAEAVDAARRGGCQDIALLHCVSSYPANPRDYNLKTVADMASSFKVHVGISDHTIDNTTAVTSIAFGGCIVEKHVTLDRAGGGPDDSFSLEPADLKALCKASKIAWEAIGKVDYQLKEGERSNVKFRRSLYFINNIKKGEKIKQSDIASVRPGYGIAPKNWYSIIGKVVNKDVLRNTAVKFSDITE